MNKKVEYKYWIKKRNKAKYNFLFLVDKKFYFLDVVLIYNLKNNIIVHRFYVKIFR